jgi:hypothetical protein
MEDWGHGECHSSLGINNHKPTSAGFSEKQVGGEHYQMAIQPLEFIIANDIPHCEANVIKYTCRHSRKNGQEDIKKAISYLSIILETRYSIKTEIQYEKGGHIEG